MRGHLWQSLAAEVQDEFDALTPSGSIDGLLATPRVSGPLWSGAMFWGRLEWMELRALPIEWRLQLRPPVVRVARSPRQRMADTRSRRAASGLCVDCDERPVAGRVRCPRHVLSARAAWSRHAAKQRAAQ